MKGKTSGFPGVVLEGGRQENEPPQPHRYQEMINRHFHMIERLSFRAVRKQLRKSGAPDNPVNIENEALELSNRVLDTLQKDDYQVLKRFKGESKLSTYITTIVARQAVDLVRKKLGRNRQKERAAVFGEVGLLVYERMIMNGESSQRLFRELETLPGAPKSQEELEELAARIGTGSTTLNNPAPTGCDENPAVKEGFTVKTGESGDSGRELVVPDPGPGPGDIAFRRERRRNIRLAVTEVVAQLSGEERIILRMRFPAGDNHTPRKAKHIAKVLGISEKAVYKRIDRLLKKCRRILEQKGVDVHELLNPCS